MRGIRCPFLTQSPRTHHNERSLNLLWPDTLDTNSKYSTRHDYSACMNIRLRQVARRTKELRDVATTRILLYVRSSCTIYLKLETCNHISITEEQYICTAAVYNYSIKFSRTWVGDGQFGWYLRSNFRTQSHSHLAVLAAHATVSRAANGRAAQLSPHATVQPM